MRVGISEFFILIIGLFLLMISIAVPVVLCVVLIRYFWNKGSEAKKNEETKKD